MGITVYKAPNCLRCKITKEFMEGKGLEYQAFDLQEQKDVVNGFYRTHRPRLYRNPEGLEFPMFHDETQDVIKQGTGEIIAWLLSGHKMETCVKRSDLLHGWISGLYVSQVPDGEEENFYTLVKTLSKGGLQVYLQSDGRKPALLKKILDEGLAEKVVLNIPGPPNVYPQAVGGPAPAAADLKDSIDAVKGYKNGLIRLWLKPVQPENGDPFYITPAQAAEAAKMVQEACGEMSLPFTIQLCPEKAEGLDMLEESALLPYRGKVRNFLVKADISKPDSH